MGLRSGLYADQSSSSTPISTNHFCMELTLCTGALPWWNRKGPSTNCYHKVGNTESSRMSLYVIVCHCMSLYAVSLRFPFTGTKGPSPDHEKQPRPLGPTDPSFVAHGLGDTEGPRKMIIGSEQGSTTGRRGGQHVHIELALIICMSISHGSKWRRYWLHHYLFL
jgi:hypothetical protein